MSRDVIVVCLVVILNSGMSYVKSLHLSIQTMPTSTEDTAEILPTFDNPVSAATPHPTVSTVVLSCCHLCLLNWRCGFSR